MIIEYIPFCWFELVTIYLAKGYEFYEPYVRAMIEEEELELTVIQFYQTYAKYRRAHGLA